MSLLKAYQLCASLQKELDNTRVEFNTLKQHIQEHHVQWPTLHKGPHVQLYFKNSLCGLCQFQIETRQPLDLSCACWTQGVIVDPYGGINCIFKGDSIERRELDEHAKRV